MYGGTDSGTVDTGTSGIWTYWISNSSSTIDTTNTIWHNWNTTLTDRTITVNTHTTWAGWVQPVIAARTAEEIKAEQDARAERMRVFAEQEAARKAERDQAAAVAEALLLEYLSEPEKEEYVAEGHFHVLSADGVSRYRIKKGQLNNVEKLDDKGVVTKVFCSHPRISVPDADNMLAQRFALMHQEDDFEKSMAFVRRVG